VASQIAINQLILLHRTRQKNNKKELRTNFYKHKKSKREQQSVKGKYLDSQVADGKTSLYCAASVGSKRQFVDQVGQAARYNRRQL